MKGYRNFLVRDLAILLLTVVMWVFFPTRDFRDARYDEVNAE